MKFSIFSAALSLCCATASYAGDNNSVFVMQDSTVNPLSGNSLFIDQSDASNASISPATGPTDRGREYRQVDPKRGCRRQRHRADPDDPGPDRGKRC